MKIPETNDRASIGGNNPPIAEVLPVTYAELTAEVEALAAKANATKRTVDDEKDLETVGELVLAAQALAKKIENARKFEKEPFDQAGKDVQAFFVPLKTRPENVANAFTSAADAYHREQAAIRRRAAEDEARKLREQEDRIRKEAEASKRESTVERKLDQADDIADRRAEAEALAQQATTAATKIRTESGMTAGTKATWKAEITDFAAIPLGPLGPFFSEAEILKAANSMARAQKGRASCPGIKFSEDHKSSFRR